MPHGHDSAAPSRAAAWAGGAIESRITSATRKVRRMTACLHETGQGINPPIMANDIASLLVGTERTNLMSADTSAVGGEADVV
jgi:hypothetical protein